MKRILPALIISLTFSVSLYAAAPESGRPQGFTENRGQILDQNKNVNAEVKYLLSTTPGVNVQLRSSGISFDTYAKSASGGAVHFHRLDLDIVGALADVKITGRKPVDGVINYATRQAKLSGLRSYREVAYENIRNGIDLVVKMQEDGLIKYDFVVHQKEAVDELRLAYSGFDHFELSDGKLIFTLSGKTITETIPASWLTTSGKNIVVKYKVIKSTDHSVVIGFESDATLSKSDGGLVIDPLSVTEWSTYYGDSGYDKPEGIATDSLGNIFIVGTTSSLERMASSDAYQATFSGGNTDVFITRFNQHGLRQWATYYGGSGDDYGLGIDVDSYQRLYVTGKTNSTDSISSSDAYQPENGGAFDAFIAEFDRHGMFIWDSFIGGSGDETGTSCHADNRGNVYVGGQTDAGGFIENDSLSALIPYSEGIDAFLVKFNAEGIMTWGTYYGGLGDEYVRSISVDSLKNCLIAGSTNSETGIAAGMSAQAQYMGNTDGYIAKFDSLGALVWGMYYGSAGRDTITGITSFGENHYISGNTDSTFVYSDTASYQSAYGGGGDAFVARLNPDGNTQWFSYLGGTALNLASNISTDYAGDIYIGGTTYTDSVFYADTLIVDSIPEDLNYFIAKFDSTGHHIYTGTYGGEGDDACTGLTVYGYTSIYTIGTTTSLTNMVLDGPEEQAYQTQFDTASVEGFIARHTQYSSTLPGGIGGGDGDGGGGGGGGGGGNGSGPPPIGVCLGDSIQLHIIGGALGQDAQWVWYEGQCGGTDNYIGEGSSIWVAPTVATWYYVRAESVHNETMCRAKFVHVDYPNTAIASANDSICPGSTLELFGDGGFYYNWSGPEGYASDEQNPVIDTIAYNQAGTYQLIATTQFGCKDTATVDVFLLEPPIYSTSVTPVTCHGGADGSIHVQVPDSADIAFSWPGIAGDTLAITGLTAGTYLLHAANYNGCTSTESIEIQEPKALIDSLETRGAYCDHPNGSAEIFVSGNNPPFSITWQPGEQTANPVENLLPGSHTAVVSDAIGCIDSLNFSIDNLGIFTTSIVPDSIFLEVFETTEVEVVNIPEPESPTYLWEPAGGLSCTDCMSPVFNPDSTTWYTLVVTSIHGCTSEDSIFVERALPEPNTFVPSAFSPNNDGLNDRLCLLGVRIISFELRIYDRSGKEVFHSDNMKNCWDGTINGAPATGSYIYTLQAVLEEDKTVNETGQITIQR